RHTQAHPPGPRGPGPRRPPACNPGEARLMRILIDLQGAQTESRFRGIGRYSMSLAQGMAKEAGDHEVWVCLNSMMPESIEAVRQGFDGLIPPSRVVTFESLVPVSWPDAGNAWRRGAAELMR